MRAIIQNILLGFVQKPLMNVAHWLGEQGHDSASARLYATLADYEPHHLRNAYLRYRSLLQEERLEEALVPLEELVTVHPDAVTLYDYGVLLQRTNRHADAVDAFDRSLSLDLNHPDCHAYRAFSLMQLERWTEAEAGLRRALRHDPRNRLAFHDLGLTLAQLERLDEAIVAFRSALEIAPDTATSMSLAYVLESLERLPEAETVLRDALRLEPQNALVISTLVEMLLQQERTDAACDLVTAADANIPNHPAIVGALVDVLLASDRLDAAVAAGERLVSFDDSAYAHAILAWAYLETRRPEDAAREIERAEAAAAAESDATISRDDLHAVRVAVLSANGQHREALALFEQLRDKRGGFYARNPELETYVRASRSALGEEKKEGAES